MRNVKTKLGLACLLLVVGLLGCEGAEDPIENPNGTDGNDSDTDSSGLNDTESSGGGFCEYGDQASVCSNLAGDGSIVLTDELNYDFSSTLNISHTVLRGASPELVFDWSTLTTDLLQRPVDPVQDIDLVLLSLWELSQEELANQINNDTLDMAFNKGAAWVLPDGTYTQAQLSSFGPMGEPATWDELLPYFNSDGVNYDPAAYTHMVMAQSGTDPGKNARMIGFFTLDSNSPETFYSITPTSTTLDYDVDLRGQEWIPAAVGNPALTINWEYVEENALGNDFSPARINTVVVAHYASMNTCDLEEGFLQLQESADGWWEAHLDTVVYSYDLSLLTDANGATFPGIDNSGTWIVALFCGECANPAPWFMTVLQPCAQ